MSYTLDRIGTVRRYVVTKVTTKYTRGGPTVVILDDFSMSIAEFLTVVRQFLTTSGLNGEDDARTRLFAYVKTFRIVKGYIAINNGKLVRASRLGSSAEMPLKDKSDPAISVQIKHCTIAAEDFLFLVCYAMTNTNLDGKEDARLAFIAQCKTGKIRAGKIVLAKTKQSP